MSSTTPRDHFNPNDPLYFAPPRLRRGPDFPLPPAPQEKSDPSRPISAAARFDALVEQAVEETRRLSPKSEIAPERRAFVFEADRDLLSLVVRIAGAIGVSALIAFFFVVLVPMSQRSDPPKPAVAENPAVVASTAPVRTNAPPTATPDDSQALLQKFVQWHQRDRTEPRAGR